MSDKMKTEQQLLCPSAQPDMQDSVLFGVVSGEVDKPRVAYLNTPQPVTEDLLELAKPVLPTEVFRFAAPCVKGACHHFDGEKCQLVVRTVQILFEAVDILPPCSIRSTCRWWAQEGKDACLRCPMVVTQVHSPSDVIVQVATTDIATTETD
jgi:hypothetical protein